MFSSLIFALETNERRTSCQLRMDCPDLLEIESPDSPESPDKSPEVTGLKKKGEARKFSPKKLENVKKNLFNENMTDVFKMPCLKCYKQAMNKKEVAEMFQHTCYPTKRYVPEDCNVIETIKDHLEVLSQMKVTRGRGGHGGRGGRGRGGGGGYSSRPSSYGSSSRGADGGECSSSSGSGYGGSYVRRY